MRHAPLLALVVSVVLTILAVGATSAQARATPAGAAMSGTATDILFSVNSGIRCPTAEFTGSISADGTAISGRLAFSDRPADATTPRITCTAAGLSATVSCSGLVTLRSDSSAAGASMSGNTLVLDAGFACTFTIPLCGTIRIAGRQTLGPAGGVGSAWDFNQATQSLQITAGFIVTTATGFCPSVPNGIFRGTYHVTPRVTIS